jgi:hypothetical protein
VGPAITISVLSDKKIQLNYYYAPDSKDKDSVTTTCKVISFIFEYYNYLVLLKKQFLFSLFTFGFSFLTSLSAQNIISTVAGDSTFAEDYSGDGGPATAAGLYSPYNVAVDHAANLYIADEGNQVIRMVTNSTGIITTVAGNNAYGLGFSGDEGQATLAELNYPAGVAVDHSGNIFIADAGNNAIREVFSRSIYTVAGIGTISGYSGDGGAATSAELNNPMDVFLDATGNLFIADAQNNVIREVIKATGIISTVAGNNAFGKGYSGDGGAATNAELNIPTGVAVDASGNIFIADFNNQVIREVNHSSGNITTVAGNNAFGKGYSGDGGAATIAELNYPSGIKVDSLDNLFIADEFNNVIREVYQSSGNIGTIAGNFSEGFGYYGDGGPATTAELNAPSGVAIDALGNLLIADNGNSVIRKVSSVTVGISKTTDISNSINIYPNPCSTEMRVSMGGEGYSLIAMYDVFGKEVYAQTLNPSQSDYVLKVNTSDLSSGVYFIQILNRRGTNTDKVVVAR